MLLSKESHSLTVPRVLFIAAKRIVQGAQKGVASMSLYLKRSIPYLNAILILILKFLRTWLFKVPVFR